MLYVYIGLWGRMRWLTLLIGVKLYKAIHFSLLVYLILAFGLLHIRNAFSLALHNGFSWLYRLLLTVSISCTYLTLLSVFIQCIAHL